MTTSAPSRSITDQLFDGDPSKSLKFANQCFGISASHGYALVKRNEYPVPVLALGKTYRVRTQDLVEALGVVAP